MPDFGPSSFVPSWGATVTGARKFLIAFNINLLSTKEQAHRIALNLREQGRGKDQVSSFQFAVSFLPPPDPQGSSLEPLGEIVHLSITALWGSQNQSSLPEIEGPLNKYLFVCVWPACVAESTLGPLSLQLHLVTSHHVDAGNEAQVL